MYEGSANEPETYKKASESVKKWHLGMLGGQQADMAFKQKLERKRAGAGVTFHGVNARTETSVKKAPPEPTASNIVAEMRAARGQPV